MRREDRASGQPGSRSFPGRGGPEPRAGRALCGSAARRGLPATAHRTRRTSPGGLALWYPPAVQPDPLPARRRPVQLFVTAIQYPIQFGIAILVAGGFVTIFLRAAISPERKTGAVGWVRAITGPNAKLFFGILFLGWVAVSGLLIPSGGPRRRPSPGRGCRRRASRSVR